MRTVPTKREPGAGPRGGGSTRLATGFVRTGLMFYSEELALLQRRALADGRSVSHVLRAAVREHLGLPPQAEESGKGKQLTFSTDEEGPVVKTVYLLKEELLGLKRRAVDEERTASDLAREAVRAYCASEET